MHWCEEENCYYTSLTCEITGKWIKYSFVTDRITSSSFVKIKKSLLQQKDCSKDIKFTLHIKWSIMKICNCLAEIVQAPTGCS